MTIKEIINSQQWNDFIAKTGGSFLQSWQWSEVQKNAGKKVWRLGVEKDGELVEGLLLIKNKLPLNKSYLFSPWASFVDFSLEKDFLNKIQEIAKSENAIFFRYEPIIEKNKNNFKIEDRRPSGLGAGVSLLIPEKDNEYKLKKIGFHFIGQVEPLHTLILDLTKSEEDLLAEMHSKTRYNIRIAQKRGVQIKCFQTLEEKIQQFDNFWNLIENTYNRKGLKAHFKSYYQEIAKQDIVKLYLAEYEGKIIVANLVIFFGDTVTYLHGGSDKNYQNTMATFLIQWQAIQDAKAQGFKHYDFYGIAGSDDPKDHWAGITRFKKGFGGEVKNYIGAWDFSFSKVWYWLYKVLKRLR